MVGFVWFDGVNAMRRSVRNWLIVLPIMGSVIVLDQITKHLVIDNLTLGESIQPIPALKAVFQITYTHNTGSAFGFLPQAGDLFLVIAVVIVLGMLYFYPRIPDGAWLTRIGTALVAGGALGNALDRIQHGPVIDFIHYQIPGVISNVSNVADHAIVLGVALIILDSWLSERREKMLEKEQASADSDEQPIPHNHAGSD
jgi:signal peptidase II